MSIPLFHIQQHLFYFQHPVTQDRGLFKVQFRRSFVHLLLQFLGQLVQFRGIHGLNIFLIISVIPFRSFGNSDQIPDRRICPFSQRNEAVFPSGQDTIGGP